VSGMAWSRVSLAALALALALPSAAVAHGGEGGDDLADHWWDAWTFSPLQLAPIVLVGILYGVRAHHLGPRLPAIKILSFYAGLLVLALALVSPVDAVAEEGLFAVHMLQHALLGGVAPALVVLGLTGAVLQPVLRFGFVQRLQVLAHPAVALPLWTAVLVFWHIPPVYEIGVENELAHALEHGSFFVTTLLVWMPVVEPLPAPPWFGTGAKIVYLVAYWFIGLMFVNILWFSGTVFYPRYEDTAPDWGVSALQDQANAGSVFMAEHMILVLTALVLLFVRFAREGALRQRLVEAGVSPDAAGRAVRYGRGEELASRMGVATTTRAGID
jgi:putative membrane protein